jgi:hypothetical protein
MVVTPSSMHLSITFINQRFSSCSPTVDVGFVKLTLDSFFRNKVFTMNIQFYCPVTCAAVVGTFRNSPSLCATISLCQCWFSPTVPLRWCWRPIIRVADITLETVALDTPNNVAVFVTDAPAKRAPTICPLSKSDKSYIFRFFHMDCHSTQSLTHSHEHYKV